MKKISRKDLQGLRRHFPVLTEDEMRHYVGGYDGGYSGGGTGNDWLNQGFYFVDPDGNFHWYRGYTQEELNYWEGNWPGGWVAGWGYVAPDSFIYGTYPDNNYNPWGDNSLWGYDSFWGYGYSSIYGYLGWPGTGFPGYYGLYGSYGYNANNNQENTGTWGGGGSSSSTDSITAAVNSFMDELTSLLKQSFTNLIAGSAEIAHEAYKEVRDFLQQHPGAIDTLRDYMSEVEVYVPVETDPNKMTWVDLFNIWLFEKETVNMRKDEKGNFLFTFEDDAQTTKDLQTQEGVQQARDKAIAQIKEGDLSSFKKSWAYDVDEFVDGIVDMNTATSFLGSYNTEVVITDNHDGTYTLKYTVKNTTGWESGTRLRVDHEGDNIHDAIIPNCERGEGIGLGGTIHEKWTWSETITIK